VLENADEVPVILTGDFNAPSHLDWTPEAASSHDGVHGVAWPTSKRVVGDGMKDSFREVNPQPELQGGVTWSPIFKGGGSSRSDRFCLLQRWGCHSGSFGGLCDGG
jgi:hypothetical protein